MAAAGIGDAAVDAGPVVGASAGIVNNNSVALAEVASAANAAASAANQAAKEAARASELVQTYAGGPSVTMRLDTQPPTMA